MSPPPPGKDMKELPAFLAAVWAGMEQLVNAAPLAPAQTELLRATLVHGRRQTGGNPFADPLGFFHLVVQAQAGRFDERAQWLGAFCQLHILALDLFDDVQDNDLAGRPHAQAGPAVAINSALTLFTLALAALHRAMAFDEDPARRAACLGLLTRVCLATSAGQHADLTGTARTPEEVLAAHRGKTSSIVLVVECAALHAGAAEHALACYRRAAEHMAVLVQLIGDLRDIFGKPASPDLQGGKITHPVAEFRALATPAQAEEFERLVRQGPAALPEIRALLYASGAVRRSAEAIETNRQAIHAAIAAFGNPHPALRTWLCLVDSLAALIYVPAPLPDSRALLQPDGPWHVAVRDLAARFAEVMRPFAPPVTPAMVPWPRSHWMYDPARRTVFYPDLDDQADEVLPGLSALLGIQDLARVRAVAVGQAPAVMAHELFHHWRDAAGRLTPDAWYEELAANRLAAAYLRCFQPDLVEATRQIAAGVLAARPDGLPSHCQAILDRLLASERCPEPVAAGYGVNLEDAALIQLAMVSRLLDETVVLQDAIADMIGRR